MKGLVQDHQVNGLRSRSGYGRGGRTQNEAKSAGDSHFIHMITSGEKMYRNEGLISIARSRRLELPFFVGPGGEPERDESQGSQHDEDEGNQDGQPETLSN